VAEGTKRRDNVTSPHGMKFEGYAEDSLALCGCGGCVVFWKFGSQGPKKGKRFRLDRKTKKASE